MFDLDQNIRRWRNELRRYGSLTDEKLDELESHLREHVERSVTGGTEKRDAFVAAKIAIGDATTLKREYRKEAITLTRLSYFTSFRRMRIMATASVALLVAYFIWAGPLFRLGLPHRPTLLVLDVFSNATVIAAALIGIGQIQDLIFRRIGVVTALLASIAYWIIGHANPNSVSIPHWLFIVLVLSWILSDRKLIYGFVVLFIIAQVLLVAYVPFAFSRLLSLDMLTSTLLYYLPVSLLLYALVQSEESFTLLAGRRGTGSMPDS